MLTRPEIEREEQLVLYFLGIIAAIAGIAAMGYGAFLVYRGYFKGDAKIEIEGWGKIDVPVGVGVFLCGLAALSFIFWKALESNTDLLTAQRDQYRDERDAKAKELVDTKNDLNKENSLRRTAQNEADTQRQRAEGLSGDLVRETGERKQAQEYARDAWIANDRLALSPDQRAELDHYVDGVMALNKELTFLRIQVARWPILSGRTAVAAFEIYRKDFENDAMRPRGAGLFQFKVQQYAIEGDSWRGMNTELAQGLAKLICDAAQRAIATGISPRDTFARIPSLARYDGDGQRVQEVAELQYVMLRLQMLAAEARILVRGYADGEQGPWQRPLDPALKDVQLHENAKPNATPVDYALEFKPDLAHRTLGLSATKYTKYGNEDLPNLRAEVTSRIVSDLLASCQPAANVKIGAINAEILDGRVYQGHSPPDRKSRIHLLVFLKEK